MKISARHPSFTFLGRSLFPNSDLMKWIRWLWRSRWIFLSKPLKWDRARMRISFGCVSTHVFMSWRSVCAQGEKRRSSYTGMIWCHIDSRLIGFVKEKRKLLHSDRSITGQSDLTDSEDLSVLIMAVQLLPSFLLHEPPLPLPPHQYACTGRDKNRAWWAWDHLACVQSSGQNIEPLHSVVWWCSHPAVIQVISVRTTVSWTNKVHLFWTHLSCGPSAHYFAHAAELTEFFQTVRLNYRGVFIQVVTHGVMATCKNNTHTLACQWATLIVNLDMLAIQK